MNKVRVLVVDDSATMRAFIRVLLSRDPAMEIAGEATDAIEARAAIKALNPDVITLDVEMPKMNGLEFLGKIMRLRPTPVIMVSSQTSRGAAAAIAALEIGAFDCIAKPEPGEHDEFADLLAATVKAASLSRLRLAPPSGARAPSSSGAPGRAYRWDGRIVAIGASTGGVEALITVLSSFPPDCPPTIVTQHMPAAFTKTFAHRLDRLCSASVCEAFDGAPLKPGQIYLAPGGVAHLEVAGPASLRCRLHSGSAVNGHRPSVDVLFQSVAKAAGARALGVILTGMGRDGAGGLLAMRQAGAATLGQDEASSLIYGMPRAAFEIGAIEKQAPLNKIAAEILSKTSLP